MDADRKDLCVGVVGTGVMGVGIAQLCAQAGIETRMFDTKPGAVAAARDRVAGVLARQVEKGKLAAEARDRTLACMKPIDALAGFAGCALVVEAVVENLAVKKELFAALEPVVGDDAIIASNTSSLSVTAMAAACKRPQRVVGWHFFNPVPLMRIVEVIEGARTDPAVSEAMMKLSRRVGHVPVRAADMPGFIVNHAGRAFLPESLRVLSDGVCEFHDVDRVMREAAGFRMGPFELADLVGLDTGFAVMESIWAQFHGEPRYRPSAIAAPRVAAGLYGRKSGRGFYEYVDGSAKPIAEPPAPPATARPVWISQAEPALAERLADALRREGADIEYESQPSDDAIVIVTPLGQDCTTAALVQGLDPRRTVAVDALFPLDKRRTLMTSPATAPEVRAAAHGRLAAGGVPVTVIRDSAGFIAQRVVAQIVSIGCDIAQRRIASPGDIDQAVRLGLSYPNGPLAMGDALGAANVLRVLENMLAITGDPCYRPSLWLARRARLGLSLLTAE